MTIDASVAKTFVSIDKYFLDRNQLRTRGWTEMLIREFLGKADNWKSVNHFRNFYGKPTWFIERVRAAESIKAFREDFAVSVHRRRLNAESVNCFVSFRIEQDAEYKAWARALTAEQIQVDLVVQEATHLMREVINGGLRTPHKG